MNGYKINRISDDHLIQVFSSEASRRVKNYKREPKQYKGKKQKKEMDKKEEWLDDEKSTIDIRC